MSPARRRSKYKSEERKVRELTGNVRDGDCFRHEGGRISERDEGVEVEDL
jgi:hypothetical protein